MANKRLYLRSGKRGLVFGLIDQGIVSLASLIFLVTAARFLDPDALGQFALGVSSILLVQSVSRALVGETLLVRVTINSERIAEVRDCLGITVLLGIAFSSLSLVVSMLWADYAEVYLGVAIAVLGILLHDCIRFIFIAEKNSTHLLMLDAAFFVLGVGAIIVAGSVSGNVTLILAGWGLSALVVGVSALFITRTVPQVVCGIRWMRKVWTQASAFAAEAVVGAVLGYATVLIIAIFSSDSEVAAFRIALSVFGVTSVAINFLRSTMLRHLSPQKVSSGRSVFSVSVKMGLIVLFAVVGTAVLLFFLPLEWGTRALGESWMLVAGILLPGMINRLAAGFSTVPAVILRVRGVQWEATFARFAVLIVSFGLGPVGAYYGGAAGALLAESVTYVLMTVTLYVLLARNIRKFPQGGGALLSYVNR